MRFLALAGPHPRSLTPRAYPLGVSRRRSLLDGGSGQLGDRAERRLRRIETQGGVLIGERGVDVGDLVPVRIPAAADLRSALVLAQADRRHDILEGTRVRVRHVGTDG